MRRTFLIVLSFITFSAFAQVVPVVPAAPPPPLPSDEANMPDTWGSRYFHFGLNGTFSYDWLTANSSNNKALGGYFGSGYGANFEFYFTRNYGILTGVEVRYIGASYRNSSYPTNSIVVDSIVTHNEGLQYLQVPLELKLKTVPFRRNRYYGVVGLDLGFLLRAKDDYNTTIAYNTGGPPVNSYQYYSGNNVDIYRQTDFFKVTFVIGGGVEHVLAGSTALQASITYNNSFTNLNNTSSNSVSIKGVEIMVGILF